MKKIITAFLCCLTCFMCFAQKIKRVEYFIDNDPGVGKGKNISITQNDTVRVSTAIQTPNLTQGLHVLYIRAANDNGWGIAENYPFTVTDTATSPAIINAEYFFDTDPGMAKAIPLSINASDTVRQKLSLVTGSLSEGLHELYIRTQSGSGKWSLSDNALFYVTNFAKAAPKLNAAEYFIDTDPGPGKAKKLSLPGAADTIQETVNIKVPAGLDTAVNHYLCIRVRNSDGAWSLYEVDTFKVKTAPAFANLDLYASLEKDHAALNWTSSAIKADGIYELEKSANGIDFELIKKVNAKPEYKSYSTTDAKLIQHFNYYRVKYTDADGNSSYSNITQLYITNKNSNSLQVFPNPAKDVVNIQFNGKRATAMINIFDAGGRHVKTFTVPVSKTIQLNISDLAAGNYLLHVSDGETISTAKLVKQ